MAVKASIATYSMQRKAVQDAIESFRDMKLVHSDESILTGVHLTGNHIWVAGKGEFWFEVHYVWNKEHPDQEGIKSQSYGWGHVFPDMAEFERIIESKDPVQSYGFRNANCAGAVLAGRY